MTTLHVDLGPRGYDIVVTSGTDAALADFIRRCCSATSALVVTDRVVRPHAEQVGELLRQQGLRTGLAVRPPGEEQKSLAVAAELYDALLDLPADRRTLVVAVGGGVIGDLAGFVAATYARGLDLLMVPTTLLAMVDSSVGGKVAVNHPRAKNLIGCFHQPRGVWIDLHTLRTLPDREYRSGLAEVVKYGVSLDADFFAWLESNAERILRRDPELLEHIVVRCCRLKADIVARDERDETGLRAVLNYGHTFAHAFETAAGYGRWLHGEAVAAGMVCASRLAERRGLIPSQLTERQRALLSRLGLPTAPEPWDRAVLLAAMRSDKKALAGKMRFILPRRLGEVALFDDVAAADVESVLAELQRTPAAAGHA
ncbi:MAG: 3-dehydroquinate synthase [Gemmataceae bacterium]|nr:3-dehydroquinate synthase [Gemmataceae bacterium]